MANTNGVNPFVDGSIVRLRLENFVTYDSVEFKPGPHLNIIIGPNGTGKSTIVCAICLGLAGKPSLLGRASNPSEFIKHSCDKATIEVELMNKDGNNYVIRREILKNNTSQWSVNNRNATFKAVEETVARLNIQVGNLCQFLPQDKVADFAKMSPQELLENTEKAIGPPNMHENHMRLKSAREDGRQLELDVKNKKELLEREKQRNARLEPDVKNYKDRQVYLDKINTLKMKRPWVEYRDRRNEYHEGKKAKDELTEQYTKAKKAYAPVLSRLQKAKDETVRIDQEIKRKTDRIRGHALESGKQTTGITTEADAIDAVRDELTMKQTEEEKRKRKSAEVETQLNALKSELASLVDTENVQPKIDEVTTNMSRTNQQMTKLHQDTEQYRVEKNELRRDITHIQNELQQVQNVSNVRLNMLRTAHKDTFNAVMWLRANTHRFKAKIHEPIMVVINMKDQAWAKYVEAHIPFKDMKAFVCEDYDDMKLFLNLTRDEQKLRISAVMDPAKNCASDKPPVPVTNYKRYGFFIYMREMFDAPEAVMRYLCTMYRVHQIPVGNRKTKEMVESVISHHPELGTFYTENHHYVIRKSKYGSATSSRCVELKKPTKLTVAVDLSRERELQQQIQMKQQQMADAEARCEQTQQKSREMEARMNGLRNEKKKLMEKKDMRKSLQQKMNLKQQSLHRLAAEKIDMEREEALAQEKIQVITNRTFNILLSLKENINQCVILGTEKVRLCLDHAQAKRMEMKLTEQQREQANSLSELERQLEGMKERMKQLRDSARQTLAAAKKATGTESSDDLPTEIRKSFEELPDTLEQIDAAIHEEQARADCTFQTDESVIQEYYKREKTILQLITESEKCEQQLDRHQDEVAQIREQWIDPLKELIGRIDKNFGFFFSAMNCAGEIDLNVPENPEDYEKYGIRIRVKYRETEQLRELTPFHQSGGERSVATVLYMMALQELTKCPFRCVDEINQGMDPQNERKVFELVVKTVCKRNTSQYFLLTPKLLPNLDYSSSMTVLTVYNGPHMVNHTDWSIRKFLKRRARFE